MLLEFFMCYLFVLFVLMFVMILFVYVEKFMLEVIIGLLLLFGLILMKFKVVLDGLCVSFLCGKEVDCNQLDLWVYDIVSGQICLLVDFKVVLFGVEILSDVEKVCCECQCIVVMIGIVDYQWLLDVCMLLFLFGGEFYLYDLGKQGQVVVCQFIYGEGFVIDVKFLFKGGFVSFVCVCNLWVIDLVSGWQIQFICDGSDIIGNGVVEFVVDEEMDCYIGYWWVLDDLVIVFVCIDESLVLVQKCYEMYVDFIEMIEQCYFVVGDYNVIVMLVVIVLQVGVVLCWIDLGCNLDIYLVCVDWCDLQCFIFQCQLCDQKILELIQVDLVFGCQYMLVIEILCIWVLLYNDLCFFKQGGFLWFFECSGFEYLYCVFEDGRMVIVLISGLWLVDELLVVDEEVGKVYFCVGIDFVCESQIYVVLLQGGVLQCLLQVFGMYSVSFVCNVSVYVDSWFSIIILLQIVLFCVNGEKIVILVENDLFDLVYFYVCYLDVQCLVEFGMFIVVDNCIVLYYSLIKLIGFDLVKCYLVVVYVYGGLVSQIVIDSWFGCGDYLFNQYLVQQGYVVFLLDNCGILCCGCDFGGVLYGVQGMVEVDDQLCGVVWLKQQFWVDLVCIGVQGWFNGGYMILMLLVKVFDMYVCGVVGVLVIDWGLYDIYYIECYMNLFGNNVKGYEEVCVLLYIDGLCLCLLLIYGMVDDNVLFINVMVLMSVLQKWGQLFELMIYLGVKYGLLGSNVLYCYCLVEDFLGCCLVF